MHRTHPDAPLIAILRNPIERAWSDFLLHRRDGNEPCETLGEALNDQERRQRDGDHRAGHYIDTGMYATQLRRWIELFPGDRLLVLLYDDLVADRDAVMQRIFDHIGVDPSFRVVEEQAINASGVPKNRAVAAVLRSRSRLRPYVSRRLIERVRPVWDAALSRLLSKPASVAQRPSIARRHLPRRGDRPRDLLGRNLDHWLEI